MGRRVEQVSLILVMVVSSVLMWTAVPAAWLWIAGRFSRVSESDMTSIAIVLTGIPATMVLIGLGLGRVERRYLDRFGSDRSTRVVGARWLASLRGSSEPEAVTALDKIMVVNVMLAVTTGMIWFFFFSGGSQRPH